MLYMRVENVIIKYNYSLYSLRVTAAIVARRYLLYTYIFIYVYTYMYNFICVKCIS